MARSIMGYDCTLHVIDEQELRQQLARQPIDPNHFNPVELCNQAILLAAKTHPYHYERGFALSFWPTAWEGVATPMPDFPDWIDECTPEVLFENLPPQLKGTLPSGIEGNFMTGIFIPTSRVKLLLDWLEAALEPLTPLERKRAKGLLAILREAAGRGLAYWEATDLGLPIATLPTELRVLDQVDLPNKFDDVRAWEAKTFLVISGGNVPVTTFVNLARWPPPMVNRAENDLGAARDPSTGAWVFKTRVGGEWQYMALPMLSESAPLEGPIEFERGEEAKSTGLLGGLFGGGKKGKGSETGPWFALSTSELCQVGTRTVVFPPVTTATVPAIRTGDSGPFRRAIGLPVAELISGTFQVEDVKARGSVLPGNGRVVLVWGGNGYSLEGSKAELRYRLDARKSHAEWSYATLGDDGFYYLSDRRLHAVRHPGAAPEPLLPKLTNIMQIANGPGDWIILREGKNTRDDAVKIYCPGEEIIIHMSNEYPGFEIRFAVYSEAIQAFVFVSSGGRLHRIPLSRLRDLPRTNARTGRKAPAK
jgi:hypothetical protein